MGFCFWLLFGFFVFFGGVLFGWGFFVECVLFCLFLVFVFVLFLTGLGYHLF